MIIVEIVNDNKIFWKIISKCLYINWILTLNSNIDGFWRITNVNYVYFSVPNLQKVLLRVLPPLSIPAYSFIIVRLICFVFLSLSYNSSSFWFIRSFLFVLVSLWFVLLCLCFLIFFNLRLFFLLVFRSDIFVSLFSLSFVSVFHIFSCQELFSKWL